MKFSIKISIFLLSLFACVTIACDDNNSDKTAQELLTGNTCWQQIKLESRDAGGNWNTVTIPDCTKDDCYQYKSNGDFALDEEDTKCNVLDPQTLTGTWALSDDEEMLTVTISGDQVVYTIKELTADKLVLESFAERTTFEPK